MPTNHFAVKEGEFAQRKQTNVRDDNKPSGLCYCPILKKDINYPYFEIIGGIEKHC